MRLSNVFMGVFAAGSLVAGSLIGCSDGGGSGSGGSGAGSATTNPTQSTGTSSGFPCSPKASCPAADKECIGLVDNAGKPTFGLRMSELNLTAPAALTTGIVKTTVQGNVTPSVAACNLNGSGTFSWLMQFDTAAGTLKTGGAKPVTDPAKGYSFVDEMVTVGTNTFAVKPVTYMAKPDAAGAFAVADGQDLFVPIYLDAGATQIVLLPLKKARLAMGTLSASQNCVGHYNAEGLDPANSCLSDPTTPSFVTGAKLDGHITLEEADGVVVSALQQSLCVLLSGNASMYGDGLKPVAKCKRTAGVIDFPGDWCNATNTAGGCKDSVALGADFAASSILINN